METRTYRPNFLCENTRNQIIGGKTPEKHNAKKKYSKHSGKFMLFQPPYLLPFPGSVSISGEYLQLPTLPQRGKRRMDHVDYFWVFREWLEGLLVVLPDSEHRWEWQCGLLIGVSEKDGKHQAFYSCIGIFCIFTVLINLHWYLILVFKWNSLMTCNVQFFSSCFLAICISSLVRCLFTSFPHCYVINFTF